MCADGCLCIQGVCVCVYCFEGVIAADACSMGSQLLLHRVERALCNRPGRLCPVLRKHNRAAWVDL